MTYLEKALEVFIKYSAEDPFNTWLITDNPIGMKAVLKNSKCSVLSKQITNLSEFATAIVSTVYPNKKILSKNEQFIILSKIANKSKLVTDNIPLPLSTVNDIMEIHKQFHWADAALIEISDTAEIIKDIIDEYEFWAEENSCLDYITVIERAIKIIEKEKFSAHKIILALEKPLNPFQNKIYKALKDYPATEIIPVDPLSFPKNINCYKYSSEKAEIENVLNQAAELLETGTRPEDILIISPAISKTETLVRESICDFYYKKEDGTVHSLEYICKNAGPATAQYPYVQAVLSALSCVATGYKLENLETVLSSPYFTKRKMKYLTPGKLHHIANISNVHRDKEEWLKLVDKVQNISDEENMSGYKYFIHEINEIPLLIKYLEPLTKGSTYREFANSCLKWLEETEWTVKEIPYEQPRKSFLKLLRTLAESIVGNEECTLSDFYYQMQRFAIENIEEIRSENPDAIRLAGFHVDRHLPAKYVFLVNMNAESTPKISTKLPPMTEEDTLILLPLFKSDQYIYDKGFMDIAVGSATDTIQISYAGTAGGKAKTPSQFLRVRGEPQEVKSKELNHSISWNQKRAGAALLSGDKANLSPVGIPECEKLIAHADGENSGSTYDANFTENSCFSQKYNDNCYYNPTEIEAYLKCPYQWFIKKYMKLYDPYDETSEASKLGDVIHTALQRFFLEFTDIVTIETKNKAVQTLFSLAEEEFDKANVHSPAWDAKKNYYIGKTRHKSPLEAFIDMEITLENEGWHFSKNLTEKYIESEILSTDGKIMKFNGRIDRIMENDSNQFQIIDYKAGYSFKYKQQENIQVALYAEAYHNYAKKDVQNGFYLKINEVNDKGELNKQGILAVANKRNAHSAEEQITAAKNLSFDAIEKMNKGCCTPKEKCEVLNCKYRYFCHHSASDEESEES